MLLVLDCGSQSIKWKLFGQGLKVLKKAKIRVKDKKNYQKVLFQELSKLKHANSATLPRLWRGRDMRMRPYEYQDANLILKVGHRVVHSGGKFREPLQINSKNLQELEKYNNLAPLHNPFNVSGIKIAGKIFPKAQQFAVFDTEFYKDLPEVAYVCGLPENLRKKHGFRRFGFHGISHEYAAKKAAQMVKKPFEKLKIISCHLGGGSSITAIKNGKATDTSMGFTPMEGLLMMTRAGDLDAGIVLKLCEEEQVNKTSEILNNQSGVKGICGISDMKEVLEAVKRRNTSAGSAQAKKAKLALDIFVYRIQKYIGAYFAVLDGCDILVFTGAIGEGSEKIRNMICKGLNILKTVKVLVIKTDEEMAIAKKIMTRY